MIKWKHVESPRKGWLSDQSHRFSQGQKQMASTKVTWRLSNYYEQVFLHRKPVTINHQIFIY